MRLTAAVFLVIAASGISGCASAGFRQVAFAGETSTAGSAPANGRSVHVVRNVQMSDTILETRIRYRVEQFLLEKGFIIAPPDTSDLYVLATFGAGERMVASMAPIHRDAEERVTRDAEGHVIGRTVLPERTEYVHVPLLKNSVWLQLLASDARYFRQTGRVKNIWRGEASMIGRPESLDTSTPFLLFATLRYFGRGTDDVVNVDVYNRNAVWSSR